MDPTAIFSSHRAVVVAAFAALAIATLVATDPGGLQRALVAAGPGGAAGENLEPITIGDGLEAYLTTTADVAAAEGAHAGWWAAGSLLDDVRSGLGTVPRILPGPRFEVRTGAAGATTSIWVIPGANASPGVMTEVSEGAFVSHPVPDASTALGMSATGRSISAAIDSSPVL
jgi:hypothetical protein